MQQRNSVLCLSSKANTQIKRDRKKRFTRKSVLKMLAVMDQSQNAPGPSNSNHQVSAPTPEEPEVAEKDFHSSGRTGRRNALPDILSQHAVVSSADLSSKLQGLTTNDNSESSDKPSTSKS
ncbi:uncharacterized protein LOC130901542 [Diorhabda carinulata]|uniref:uncharacterized protein LOC130440922 n=1 Tax=Diorhabda sublineata TaxID=1163346 RepID=UPI0024E0FF33|nr:uncharacterized protein LOC130440922 [Diorhabda sublineata]XP_057668977.1 uncharacterized protein LOC130901542 [Diorhabda carinulata]